MHFLIGRTHNEYSIILVLIGRSVSENQSCLIGRGWVGRVTVVWIWHEATYLSIYSCIVRELLEILSHHVTYFKCITPLCYLIEEGWGWGGRGLWSGSFLARCKGEGFVG